MKVLKTVFATLAVIMFMGVLTIGAGMRSVELNSIMGIHKDLSLPTITTDLVIVGAIACVVIGLLVMLVGYTSTSSEKTSTKTSTK